MTKQRKSDGIFGLCADYDSSLIILMPVPWEVTTSYGSGTSRGPEAIYSASPQVDLYDPRFSNDAADAFTAGFFWDNHFDSKALYEQSERLKPLAQQAIQEWDDNGAITSREAINNLETVNSGCAQMVAAVYTRTKEILEQDKVPVVIGGDHSTPLGAIRAICETHGAEKVGVLHIDAHADLRLAYQGFQFSHASIMRNVCQLKKPPQKLVQVGIRDYCREEAEFIRQQTERIQTFFDQELKRQLFTGEPWESICEKIVSSLPKLVYVSFDIDGLSPEFCPHTGTPVPGGLSFDQASYLLEKVSRSGRKIVGFDLNEVAPGPNDDEWDGNVGARLLFQLCSWAALTNQV